MSKSRKTKTTTTPLKDLYPPCFITSITFRKGSTLFASVALAAAFALALPSGRFLAAALANPGYLSAEICHWLCNKGMDNGKFIVMYRRFMMIYLLNMM